MTPYKKAFRTLILSMVSLVSFTTVLAQAEPSKIAEPSYEATLYVVASSASGAQGTALPQSLNAIARQVKNEFGAPNMVLISTYLGRLTNTGSVEYKGVSNSYSQDAMPGSPTFLDWRLVGLRSMQDTAGQAVYQFQTFRFGARVPVRVSSGQDEKTPVINYESTGLGLERVSVRDNVPTLVGTLTQPKTEGTLFLILTVKNVEK